MTTTDCASGCASRSARDDVDAGAVGQAEVDQREVELAPRDTSSSASCTRAASEICGLRKDLQHQRLQPGADFGQVFEQQDVVHGGALAYGRRMDSDRCVTAGCRRPRAVRRATQSGSVSRITVP